MSSYFNFVTFIMKLAVFFIAFYIIPCIVMSLLQFEKDTGILHSILDFVKWHMKEEKIMYSLKSKLESLKTEYKLIQKTSHQKLHKLKLFHLMNRIFNEKHDPLLNLEVNVGNLNKLLLPQVWVGSTDLVFSMMAFTYIQAFNLAHPQTLSDGLKVDTHFGGTLKQRHAMEIGVFSLYRDLYDMSVEWLEFGRKNAEKLTDLLDSLISLAIQQHNRIGFLIHKVKSTDISQQKAINLYTKDIHVNQPANERLSTRKYEFDTFKRTGSNVNTTIYVKTVELCMGNKHPSIIPFQSHLKCYLERKRHPYFYINPVKTEKLAESPPIYQFYEVLSKKMMHKLKTRFLPLVKPESSLLGAMREERCGNHARTRLFYDEGPHELFQLSERLSGLNIMKMWNQNFLAEYTYGRMYSVHMDHSINSPEVAGLDDSRLEAVHRIEDRYATLLYYLEVPETGGHTPFLEAGVFAHPVKASAIFWYNMYRNGTLRYDVTHGSCPVLHGSKIIVNHFFWHNNNWNKSRCTLNRME